MIVGASRRINTWWVLETDVCILSVQAMLALGVGMAKIHGLGGQHIHRKCCRYADALVSRKYIGTAFRDNIKRKQNFECLISMTLIAEFSRGNLC